VSDGGAVTWAELLADSSTALGDAREARWICEQAGGFSAAEFAASRDEAVRTSMAVAVHAMVRRRCEGEPLQYVLGRWAFRHLDLLVQQIAEDHADPRRQRLLPRSALHRYITHLSRGDALATLLRSLGFRGPDAALLEGVVQGA
jgi:LPS sulfotransferase NodH